MEDSSQLPQDFSTSVVQQPLTGLLNAVYTCPVCNAVVLRISGNSVEYSTTHTDSVPTVTPDTNALAFHHFNVLPHSVAIDTGDCVPGKMYAPEEPFLVISSTTITPYQGS